MIGVFFELRIIIGKQDNWRFMKINTFKLSTILIIFSIFSTPLWAKHESDHPLSEEDWAMIERNIKLIDNMNFMPVLLPILMKNRDTLELTKEQIEHFRGWRKQNYVPMVNIMNNIVEKRLAFKKASLNPAVSNEKLFELQNKSLDSQKELLAIKLSCRKMLVESFTGEQWEQFEFIVSDDPKLASFIN